jgi:hypothetical protein
VYGDDGGIIDGIRICEVSVDVCVVHSHQLLLMVKL